MNTWHETSSDFTILTAVDVGMPQKRHMERSWVLWHIVSGPCDTMQCTSNATSNATVGNTMNLLEDVVCFKPWPDVPVVKSCWCLCSCLMCTSFQRRDVTPRCCNDPMVTGTPPSWESSQKVHRQKKKALLRTWVSCKPPVKSSNTSPPSKKVCGDDQLAVPHSPSSEPISAAKTRVAEWNALLGANRYNRCTRPARDPPKPGSWCYSAPATHDALPMGTRR